MSTLVLKDAHHTLTPYFILEAFVRSRMSSTFYKVLYPGTSACVHNESKPSLYLDTFVTDLDSVFTPEVLNGDIETGLCGNQFSFEPCKSLSCSVCHAVSHTTPTNLLMTQIVRIG